MFRKSSVQELKDQLDRALRKDKPKDALDIYEKLERAEPTEPRWPHRKGDLLQRLGKRPDAIASYERAVDRYAKMGFVARAAAMAKVVLGLDASRTDVLERVDPEAARRLHRQERRPLALDLPADGAPRTSLMMEALSLIPADDAGADEVRFVDTDDGAPILEIDLDELEVGLSGPPPGEPENAGPTGEGSERGAAPQSAARPPAEAEDDDFVLIDFDDEAPRVGATELARMPSVPLFAEVPRAALSRLVLDSELLLLADGELLVQVGDPSDALFVVVAGRLRVDVPGLGEAVATLREGDVAGESCLLDEVSRRADLVAMGPAQALRIPKTVLDELVTEHPQVGEVLLELLGRRLIGNLLQTSPLFAAFDPATRAELAKLFELRRAEEGVHLIQAGKRSDGLYVPLLGRLEARGASGGAVALPLGETVGQLSLLTHQPAETTVTAATDALLLRLPASRFTQLAALYPPVLAHLTELAATLSG